MFFPSSVHSIRTHPFIKVFILSEIFLWSAWNLVIPILAVFIVKDISGGNLAFAATGFSTYLLTRVIFEFLSGKFFAKYSDSKKIRFVIAGNLITTVAFISFISSSAIYQIFLSYAVLGVGMGFASPLKFSLFSVHLDQHKESSEWGIYDGLTFIGMAFSTSIGGYIAAAFGFRILFIVSAAVTLISTVPYAWYLKNLNLVRQSRDF